MDRIREALDKSRAALEIPRETEDVATLTPLPTTARRQEMPAWSPPAIRLDPRRFATSRILSDTPHEPGHVAFNMLRTRVRKALGANNWQTIAVTSPSPGCGKTMVSLNLAFSLARIPTCRTVLLDLDLKKPSIATALGIDSYTPLSSYLAGLVDARDVFVQANDNLVLALNDTAIDGSSEAIQSQGIGGLLDFVRATLRPEVIVVDLPPMSVGDDVLAVLPSIDTTLLVAASGQTTVAEIDECEAQLNQMEKLLGVVLNKCEPTSHQGYYY